MGLPHTDDAWDTSGELGMGMRMHVAVAKDTIPFDDDTKQQMTLYYLELSKPYPTVFCKTEGLKQNYSSIQTQQQIEKVINAFAKSG